MDEANGHVCCVESCTNSRYVVEHNRHFRFVDEQSGTNFHYVAEMNGAPSDQQTDMLTSLAGRAPKGKADMLTSLAGREPKENSWRTFFKHVAPDIGCAFHSNEEICA